MFSTRDIHDLLRTGSDPDRVAAAVDFTGQAAYPLNCSYLNAEGEEASLASTTRHLATHGLDVVTTIVAL